MSKELVLQEVVRQADEGRLFCYFCREQLAGDVLCFWLDVEKFRTLAKRSSEAGDESAKRRRRLLEQAVEIRDKFLSNAFVELDCVASGDAGAAAKARVLTGIANAASSSGLANVSVDLFEELQCEARAELDRLLAQFSTWPQLLEYRKLQAEPQTPSAHAKSAAAFMERQRRARPLTQSLGQLESSMEILASLHSSTTPFGASLPESLRMQGLCSGPCVAGVPLPHILYRCVEAIFHFGLTTPKLLRGKMEPDSPASRLKELFSQDYADVNLKEALWSRQSAGAIAEGEIEGVKFSVLDVGTLLRVYVSEVQDGFIPASQMEAMLAIAAAKLAADTKEKEDEAVRELKLFILSLPHENRAALQAVLFLAYHLEQHSAANGTGANSIVRALKAIFLPLYEAKKEATADKDGKRHFHLQMVRSRSVELLHASVVAMMMIIEYPRLFPVPFPLGSTKHMELEAKVIAHDAPIAAITTHAFDPAVVWTGDTAGNIKTWGTRPLRAPRSEISLGRPLTKLVTIDSTAWAIGLDHLTVIDMGSNKIVSQHNVRLCSISLGTDNSVWCGGELKIFVFDRYRYTIVREIHILTDDDTNAQVLCTAIARDSLRNRMFCGCSDGRIVVYSGEDGEELLSFHAHGKAVTGLQVSADSLWSCSEEGTVCTWKVTAGDASHPPTNELLSKSDQHGDRVMGLVNVQDRFVLSYSADGTLLVWDAAESVPVGVGKGFHSARFAGLVFQVDDMDVCRAWTVSYDRSICQLKMNVDTWHRDMYCGTSSNKVVATPRMPSSEMPSASTSVVDLSCLVPLSLDPTAALRAKQSQVDTILQRVLGIRGMQVVDSQELAVDFSRSVGEGSFGVSYRGTWLQQDVSVKVVRDEILADPACHDLVVEHISVLLSIQHPNVQLFIGVSVCESTGRLYLVFEYVARTTLATLIEQRASLTVANRLSIARQVGLAVQWMHQHSPSVNHGDLRSKNFVVAENNRVAITNVGLTPLKLFLTGRTSDIGRWLPWHMPPELLDPKGWTGAPLPSGVDQYAFAVLLYELWVWKPMAVANVRTFEALQQHVGGGKLVDWSAAGMPTALREMAMQCADPDPAKRPSFTEIMAKFDDVLIDCLIWDKKGRALWRNFYRGRDTVLWVKLKSAIAEYVGSQPTERDLKCLNSVLDSNGTGYVTIQQFSDFLRWFGPLDENMMKRVTSLLKHDWFHGDISAQEAQRRLTRAKKKGTFLMRFSAGSPGNFALSVLTSKGIQHLRVKQVVGKGFQVSGGSVYPTLQELVKKTKAGIKTPCKGSKYAFVFRPCVSSGYSVVS